jgi:alkylhydroperoxidase family enzyme
MYHLPVSGFPVIEPEEADPELTALYARLQQHAGLTYVPNSAKGLSASPASMRIYIGMQQAFEENITLPQSLIPIILYTVAAARNCTYCATTNAMYCRTLGVDNDTLVKLANDIESVSPERLQVIIQFAVKCAFNPQDLVETDYDKVREQGINDDELAQIIFLAALANFNDTLADSFRIDLEPGVMDDLNK